MVMGCNKCTCCLGCLAPSCFITGLVLVGSALALMFIFPVILEQQVEDRVVVQPGSATFQQLLSPSVPLFKDIYFFNLTNPVEFQAGAKPNLTEIGPYSYRESRVKNILNVSEDGSLLTYNQTRVFNFSPETSRAGLTETDTICTINLPLVAAVAQLQDAMLSGLIQGLLDGIGPRVLQGIIDRADAELYVCQPATALAFSYTDELIQDLNSNLLLRAVDLNYPRTDVSIQLNNSANNSLPSTINTGVGDIDNIGQYVQWQGNAEEIQVWPNGMGANDINGTEGLFFHPFLQEGEEVQIYVDDTFRSFTLVQTDIVNLMGVRAFRFMFVNSTFESAFTNPENARWGSFNPDGLFFLGPTQDPVVPVYGSKPHFLDGDPALLEKVNGLSPNRALHESFLDVEPTTGANVQVQIQIQINAQVNQSADISQLENVNGTVYLPILYINQHTVLTQSFVDFLMDNGLSEINLFSTLVPALFGLLLAIAAVCFLVSVISCISCLCRVHKRRTGRMDSLKKSGPAFVNTDLINPPGAVNTVSVDLQKPTQTAELRDIELETSLQGNEAYSSQNQERNNELENSFESYEGNNETLEREDLRQKSYDMSKENEDDDSDIEIPNYINTYSGKNHHIEQQPESSLVSNDNYVYAYENQVPQ